MSLKGIMSISGMPGLYKVISQTKSGFIVESLADQKKTMVNSSQKISMLDDISVFTSGGDKSLKEVLLSIKEKTSGDLPVTSRSEPAELRTYLKSIVPDFDEDRVYPSDIKKIISWYGLLKDVVGDEAAAEDKSAETSPVTAPGTETETEKGDSAIEDTTKDTAAEAKQKED